MKNTDKSFPKPSAQLAAMALKEFGFRDIVMSPGTRNAPLLLALDRPEDFRLHHIIDERAAAFFALGLAQTTQRPVALVCTSGSALLNYAPAFAEAYYRRIPLIALTADRPNEWIDQSDNQTIRQVGALTAVVKKTVEIPDFQPDDINLRQYSERLIADALTFSSKSPAGPVHINFPFDLPLGLDYPPLKEVRLPRLISSAPHLDNIQVKELAEKCSDKKILVVCGSLPPSHRLNKAFSRLAVIPDVVVLAEPLANLHADSIHYQIDATLSELTDEGHPDLVIVCGGTLVSERLKGYIRSLKDAEQWYVGPYADSLQDTFRILSLAVESEPELFFPAFASHLMRFKRNDEDRKFPVIWKKASQKGYEKYHRILSHSPWSEATALDFIFKKIPDTFNLHISNGTAIRYASLGGVHEFHGVWSNRGVSGIEGSTSTAVGAATAYRQSTLLITGDMSFGYDIGALGIGEIPSNFKIIVLSNSGGGIFRVIGKTSSLPNREKLFCVPPVLPLENLAKAYGFKYFISDSMDTLKSQINDFMNSDDAPSILEIKVDPEITAQVLKNIYSQL